MRRPLALRGDFTAADLKRLARASRDADQTRRLLALAVIYDGGSRTEAAGQSLETRRHPAGGARGDRRARADPGGRRRGPVAADRSRRLGLGGVRHLNQRGDAEPGAERPRLRQALGAAAPPCPERGADRRF